MKKNYYFTLFFFALILGSVNAKAQKPVVVVLEIKATYGFKKSASEKVDKLLREQISQRSTKHDILSVEEMESRFLKYKKAINNCYDDCDLLKSRAAQAHYFISANLTKMKDKIVLELKMRETQKGEVLSLKEIKSSKVRGMEKALKTGLSEFLIPLKGHTVASSGKIKKNEKTDTQKTQDILFSGSLVTKKRLNTNARQARDIETVKEKEKNASFVTLSNKPVSMEKYEYSERKSSKTVSIFKRKSTVKAPLSGAPTKKFGVGLFAGYPIIIENGTDMKNAMKSLFHMGLEGNYQLLKNMEIAIVVDLHFLGSKGVIKTAQIPASSNTNVTLDVDFRLKRYNAFGLRPCLRVNFNPGPVEIIVGAGMGIHRYNAAGNVNHPDNGEFKFESSDTSFYAVGELGVFYRFLKDEMFGLGLYVIYLVSSHGKPDKFDVSSISWEASTKTSNTVADHLGSMDILSLGLAADLRF